MRRSEIIAALIIIFIIALVTSFSYMTGMFHKPATVSQGVNTAGSGATVSIICRDGSCKNFTVEVADTPGERATGLMNRTSLAADAGMLFVFPDYDRRCFWMENTLIPLDMVFIDRDGRIIDIHENAAPLDKKLITSSGPCQYVLEVDGGTCAARAIEIGDRAYIAGYQGLPG